MDGGMQPEPEVIALPPARRGLHLLLPDHHRRLDAMCHEMLGSACSDDPRELVARWAELEIELRDHLAAEEEVILPSYAKHAPADARKILDDHVVIRDLMTPIGVEIELHETRLARLRRLVDALAAHALHEDSAMYPWAERHLTAVAQQVLFVRIGRWFSGT